MYTTNFKKFGSNPIPKPEDFDLDRYDDAVKAFLDEVYEVYGQFSALKLRQMTHSEPPWQTSTVGAVIPQEALAEFFKTRLVSE